jgi:hypothetical protein
MWKFLREHPFAAVGMVVGSLISVASRMNDAYALINAGLPASAWEAIGAAIFFLSVIALLLNWHKASDQAGTTEFAAHAGKSFPTTDWDKPLEKQFRVHFRNQSVLIDGYEFIDCTFENVTFQYQGMRPFRFTGKTTGNSRKLTTDNAVVGQTLQLVQFFRPDFGVDYEVFRTGTRPTADVRDTTAGASERKDLIAQARKFLARKSNVSYDDFRKQLQTDIAFINLRPHLRPDFVEKLRASAYHVIGNDKSGMSSLAVWYQEELERLEREWGLL